MSDDDFGDLFAELQENENQHDNQHMSDDSSHTTENNPGSVDQKNTIFTNETTPQSISTMFATATKDIKFALESLLTLQSYDYNEYIKRITTHYENLQHNHDLLYSCLRTRNNNQFAEIVLSYILYQNQHHSSTRAIFTHLPFTESSHISLIPALQSDFHLISLHIQSFLSKYETILKKCKVFHIIYRFTQLHTTNDLISHYHNLHRFFWTNFQSIFNTPQFKALFSPSPQGKPNHYYHIFILDFFTLLKFLVSAHNAHKAIYTTPTSFRSHSVSLIEAATLAGNCEGVYVIISLALRATGVLSGPLFYELLRAAQTMDDKSFISMELVQHLYANATPLPTSAEIHSTALSTLLAKQAPPALNATTFDTPLSFSLPLTHNLYMPHDDVDVTQTALQLLITLFSLDKTPPISSYHAKATTNNIIKHFITLYTKDCKMLNMTTYTCIQHCSWYITRSDYFALTTFAVEGEYVPNAEILYTDRLSPDPLAISHYFLSQKRAVEANAQGRNIPRVNDPDKFGFDEIDESSKETLAFLEPNSSMDPNLSLELRYPNVLVDYDDITQKPHYLSCLALTTKTLENVVLTRPDFPHYFDPAPAQVKEDAPRFPVTLDLKNALLHHKTYPFCLLPPSHDESFNGGDMDTSKSLFLSEGKLLSQQCTSQFPPQQTHAPSYPPLPEIVFYPADEDMSGLPTTWATSFARKLFALDPTTYFYGSCTGDGENQDNHKKYPDCWYKNYSLSNESAVSHYWLCILLSTPQLSNLCDIDVVLEQFGLISELYNITIKDMFSLCIHFYNPTVIIKFFYIIAQYFLLDQTKHTSLDDEDFRIVLTMLVNTIAIITYPTFYSTQDTLGSHPNEGKFNEVNYVLNSRITLQTIQVFENIILSVLHNAANIFTDPNHAIMLWNVLLTFTSNDDFIYSTTTTCFADSIPSLLFHNNMMLYMKKWLKTYHHQFIMTTMPQLSQTSYFSNFVSQIYETPYFTPLTAYILSLSWIYASLSNIPLKVTNPTTTKDLPRQAPVVLFTPVQHLLSDSSIIQLIRHLTAFIAHDLIKTSLAQKKFHLIGHIGKSPLLNYILYVLRVIMIHFPYKKIMLETIPVIGTLDLFIQSIQSGTLPRHLSLFTSQTSESQFYSHNIAPLYALVHSHGINDSNFAASFHSLQFTTPLQLYNLLVPHHIFNGGYLKSNDGSTIDCWQLPNNATVTQSNFDTVPDDVLMKDIRAIYRDVLGAVNPNPPKSRVMSSHWTSWTYLSMLYVCSLESSQTNILVPLKWIEQQSTMGYYCNQPQSRRDENIYGIEHQIAQQFILKITGPVSKSKTHKGKAWFVENYEKTPRDHASGYSASRDIKVTPRRSAGVIEAVTHPANSVLSFNRDVAKAAESSNKVVPIDQNGMIIYPPTHHLMSSLFGLTGESSFQEFVPKHIGLMNVFLLIDTAQQDE